MSKLAPILLVLSFVCLFSDCGKPGGNSADQLVDPPAEPVSITNSNTGNPESQTLPLPTETIETSDSAIGSFDFLNYTYPLPRGWQGTINEITLVNGKAPVSLDVEERKIGASYVKTKFADFTGDGRDEAVVIIKIETGGAALPQIVYVFEWKNERPEIIWYFRTGDRADGGLRQLWAENGEMVIELYGQDRYIFGDVETMKVTGDEEQLCCPTYFTRNRYRLTGNRFVLQGKRETYSIAEPDAPPVENLGDKKAEAEKKK